MDFQFLQQGVFVLLLLVGSFQLGYFYGINRSRTTWFMEIFSTLHAMGMIGNFVIEEEDDDGDSTEE